MKRLACLVFLVFMSWAVQAQFLPPTHLLLSNNRCLIQACPPVNVPPPTTIAPGSPFQIYAAAQSGTSGRATGFTGTVFFSSSDPLATLPSSYTFVLTDEGGREFTAILRTPGVQTIFVHDSAGNLPPGILVMTVTGPGLAQPIPTISRVGLLAFVLGLAIAAMAVLRLRG